MENLRKNTLEFLSICDGAHQLAKGLHWGADKHSQHILMDEVDESVLEYQDKVAEIVMGMIGDKYKPGELKSLVSNARDIKGMLNELESDVISYKTKIGDDKRMAALHNVIDDFLSDINKWKYLETLS